jgi:DNA-binding NtrC family response regulator
MDSRPSSTCDGPAQAFVGTSSVAAGVRHLIGRAARSTAPVLTMGPSGSGKEIVSRAIHDASNRREAPFLAIDCGTLGGDTASSTLFGHVRGAFTGCLADRTGAFVDAHAGTLVS